MEPADTFGDYEQVKGRVMRTYSLGYEVRPVKKIYQCLAYNRQNLKELWNLRLKRRQRPDRDLDPFFTDLDKLGRGKLPRCSYKSNI